MFKLKKSIVLPLMALLSLSLSTLVLANNRIYDIDNDADVRVFVEGVLDGIIEPNQVMNDGTTALMIGAGAGNIIIVDKLLDMGADPNQENNEGFTALISACAAATFDAIKDEISNPQEIEWAKQLFVSGGKHEEVVQHLLQKGANPDKKINGLSAIDLARETGCTKCVKILEKYQENYNKKDL